MNDEVDRSWIEATTRAAINPGKADAFAQLGIDLIESGRSRCHVFDIDGRRILDALCDGSTYTFGHRHLVLVEALVEALNTYDIGCQFVSSGPRAVLADALVTNSPAGLEYVHFVPSGSEGIDAAIKAARLATGRQRIVTIDHAFHGVTGLAAVASGDHYAAPFGLGREPEWTSVPWDDTEAMRWALEGDDVAAVLLETVPATLGWPIPDDDYLPTVRRLCYDSGALMIADEVQTGLGRLGTLWGVDHWGVAPDMLVMAKGAGGGLYPLGYLLMNERSASWLRSDPLTMPSTFGGSELGCVVGKAALDLALAPQFSANIGERQKQFADGLGRIMSDFPDRIHEIRQLGMAMAIKFNDPRGGLKMSRALYGRNVLAIFAANDVSVIQLKPPLIMNESEAAELLNATAEAVASLDETGGQMGDVEKQLGEAG